MANTNSYITSAPNQDNTGRVLTFGYKAITDTATIALVPTDYSTVVNITELTANTTITVDVSTATAGIGARLDIILTGDATSPDTNYTVTFSTGFKVQTTNILTVTARKYGRASFIFNGSYWIGNAFVTA
jgi:hypothetical protein